MRVPTMLGWADKRRHFSDAQVLTTALLAARFFGGNPAATRRYAVLGHEKPR